MLAGCSRRKPEPIVEQPPTYPKRVVSMAPGLTRILLDIGAEPLLVGVSDHCPFPKERELPRLGTLAHPDLQGIAKLKPDLVLTVHQPQLERELHGKDLPLEVVSLDSFTKLVDAYTRIGTLLGMPDAAREGVRRTTARILKLKSKLQGLDRPSVLMVLGPHPRWVAGPRSMFNDIIRFAWGRNAATRRNGRLYPLSASEVRRAAPDVIVVLMDRRGKRREQLRRERRFWRQFQDVPAIRHGRLLVLDEGPFLEVGPRSVDGTQLLARRLHPDRFQ